jgi:hypothetical protein
MFTQELKDLTDSLAASQLQVAELTKQVNKLLSANAMPPSPKIPTYKGIPFSGSGIPSVEEFAYRLSAHNLLYSVSDNMKLLVLQSGCTGSAHTWLRQYIQLSPQANYQVVKVAHWVNSSRTEPKLNVPRFVSTPYTKKDLSLPSIASSLTYFYS